MNRRTSSLRAAAGAAVENLELRQLLAYAPGVEITPDAQIFQELFGSSIATNGNLALVGAPAGPDGSRVGRAFLIDTTLAAEDAIIHEFVNPSPSLDADRFGTAVAWVNGKIAISEPQNFIGGTGRVWIYDDANDTSPVELLSPLTNQVDARSFGGSIASIGTDVFVTIENDGGGPSSPAVLRYDSVSGTLLDSYAFERNSLPMLLAAKDTTLLVSGLAAGLASVIQVDPYDDYAVLQTFDNGGDSSFGASIEVIGDSILIGAPGSGEVYRYFDNASPTQTFTAPLGNVTFWGFGTSIAVSGDKLLVGDAGANTTTHSDAGEAYLFSLATATYIETVESATPRDFEEFGTLAAALPGERFLVTDPFHYTNDIDLEDANAFGAVYLFEPGVSNTAPSDAAIAGQANAVRQQTIDFSGSFTDPDVGDTHTIDWDFGDGNTITDGALDVSHAYQNAGVYTVTLTVTDAANASTSATFDVTVTAAGVQGGVLYVGGTGGADNITITKSGSGSSVNVNGSPVIFSGGRIVIYGGDGNDVIGVSSAVTASIEAYGGAGNDSISGGAGADILLGGTGNDILYGHSGRDVLIGGDGADGVYGEVDDDILIAGTTVHDNDSAALNAILAEWNSASAAATRVASLQATHLDKDTQVFDDGDVDTLTGKNGDDWFFFNNDVGVLDIVTDLKASDFGDDLDFIPPACSRRVARRNENPRDHHPGGFPLERFRGLGS
ncbi:MAG: PKD domain-containing protein [Tepidisphaeraceae bacterium]